MRRARDSFWLAIPLVFSAAVYHPIVRNYFHADDFVNLYRILNEDFLTYLFWPQGGHLLHTRNALFWLSHAAFGLEPSYYLTVALLTHLLNVYLLFRVIRVFSGSDRLACFGATLWGVSPVHEGSLGWYSVYGHVLASTAFLLLLLDLGRHASEGREPTARSRLRWYVLAVACCTSFGVGIGMALAFPFVAALLLPVPQGRWPRPPLLSLCVVVPALYFGTFALYATLSGGSSEAARLAQSDWLRPQSILSMVGQLFAYGLTHLSLPFVYDEKRFPDLVSTLVSALALLAGGTLLLRGPSSARRQLLSFLLVAFGCYLVIALGRASIFELFGRTGAPVQRYHYAAFLGLALGTCVVLKAAADRLRIPSATRTSLLLTYIVVLAVAWTTSTRRIRHYEADARLVKDALAVMDNQIAQCRGCEIVEIENRYLRQLCPLHPPTIFPGWAALFVIFHPDNSVDGKRVVFVEKDERILAVAERGWRTRNLLAFQ